MVRIDTKRGRDGLNARREPYWYKLSRDRHLGLRKLSEKSIGSWIARYRDEARQRHYKSLGECSDTFDFDAAKVAAEIWFRDKEQGLRDRDEEDGPATIATACRAYVRALLGEERPEAAQDAHMRFRRTVDLVSTKHTRRLTLTRRTQYRNHILGQPNDASLWRTRSRRCPCLEYALRGLKHGTWNW